MRTQAKSLVGRKNFKSFVASDQFKRKRGGQQDAVRTVKRLAISKKGDILTIDIEADGFLYKMVRNIVGTLLAAGSGKLPKGGIRRILSKRDRSAAAVTAKAHGLTLVSVKY